jgi:hypothetical protein
MHFQGIACTRSFDMGWTSAEGKMLECFKWASNKKYFYEHYENLVSPLCSKNMPVFYIAQAFSICTSWSICPAKKYLKKFVISSVNTDPESYLDLPVSSTPVRWVSYWKKSFTGLSKFCYKMEILHRTIFYNFKHIFYILASLHEGSTLLV